MTMKEAKALRAQTHMVWTDGATYKCLLGTSFGPVENPSAWEVV